MYIFPVNFFLLIFFFFCSTKFSRIHTHCIDIPNQQVASRDRSLVTPMEREMLFHQWVGQWSTLQWFTLLYFNDQFVNLDASFSRAISLREPN